MKATITKWIRREEVVIAPFAIGALGAVAAYVDTVLTTVHPSGQLDVALVMLATLATQAVVVWAKKRAAVLPA